MAEELKVVITGADGVSKTFLAVEKSAGKMGDGIESAAKQSARSLKEVEAASKRAEDAGRKLGQGALALGASFLLASRSTVENQRQSALLTRQYGEQADGLRELADEIQRTTTFSDEQAVSALNTFATLERNYGLTAAQIEQLTRVTVDLAAATGFELNDAAMRVQAAIRGEGEAAEALGLTMNQQAIDRENLTLTMSNQEAAQFRLNALFEQTAFAEGAAAERAATTAGQVTQLANKVQDATQRFVEFTGPIGEGAGALGSFGLEAGLAAGGLVRLGQGLVTAAPLVAGFATGPVGLGVLALGAAAAGAAFLIMRDNSDQATEGLRAADSAARDLIATWNDLAQAGDPLALLQETLGKQLDLVGLELTDQTRKVPELRGELDKAREALNAYELGSASTRQEMERGGFVLAEQRIRVRELEVALADAEGAAELFADADLALTQILRHQGEGADKAIDAVLNLAAAWDAGNITSEQFARGIIEQERLLSEYDRQAIAAAESTNALGDAATRTFSAFRPFSTGTKELSDRLRDYEDGAGRAALATEELNRQQAETAEWAQTNSDRLRDYAEGGERAADATEDMLRRISLPPDITIPEFVAPGSLIDARSAVDGLAGSYLNLGLGIMNANDAAGIFKGTQDGLIAAQSEYTQQQSEYGSQLNALQEAEDLLNERRAAGVALTAEQEDFLTRVDEAQGRLTGGVEDAILAEGNLALQYAENVRIGDQLNSTMEGQQAITSALIGLVTDLIGALDGIPEDVRTNVELIGADAAIGQAATLAGTLASIPLSKRIDIVTAFSQTGTPPALAGLGGGIVFQHGGIVPAVETAQHGITSRGRLALVGESGPELVRLPPAAHVSPAPATRAALSGRGGDRPIVININAPIYGVDDLNRAMDDALRRARYAESRS